MNELSLADVAALRGNGDDGLGGNGGWWIILLFILLGGWGNRGWGNGQGGAGGDALYPWLNQAQLTTQGFADQNTVMALNGIQGSITSGFANAATQLCNCCSDMQMALANGFAGVEAGANARQMANMQQAYAAQTAMMQGFTGQQAQTAQLAADLGLGMANQTATILAEHCSDRAALSDGVRDIIAANAAGTQRILDQMCADKIDAKNEEIANLRQQLTMANLAASQNAQTQTLLADNFAQTSALEQYLAPVPRPAYIVQNPNCCQQSYGCGCVA